MKNDQLGARKHQAHGNADDGGDGVQPEPPLFPEPGRNGCHNVNDAKYGATTIFSIPEVVAMVSMGTPVTKITLPPVQRIVGRPDVVPGGPPVDGELVVELSTIKGALCQMGSSKQTAVRY